MSQSDPPAQDISNAKRMLTAPICCMKEANDHQAVGVACHHILTSPIYTSRTFTHLLYHLHALTKEPPAPSSSELAEMPRPPVTAAESARRRPSERRIHLRPSQRVCEREVSDVLRAAPVLQKC